jgi:SagB-type dehydrogenase family enzyme
MQGARADASPPGLYKEYVDAPRVALPPPDPLSEMAMDEALRKRRSVRAYAERPLSSRQLSYLLWAASGIQPRDGERFFRTAPSAGALYPVETYVVVNNVEGVAPGVYHYAVASHSLEELRSGDHRRAVTGAVMGQKWCEQAGAVIIWTAVFGRSTWRYRDRTYRYVYLDAGHMAQNLALSAVTLGLGACQIGALYDDEVNAIIGVDGEEEGVLYMSVVGWPAG